MNFQYTVNVESDEPVMLINKHIGYDEVDGFGIMGDLFQAELLALDQMDKKKIHVWINSVGGIVMDGYNIYNAILKSKTKVDTYCMGICASIAGVIFQAGRNRVMADYGKLMYHNPFGGSDQKSLDAMKDSLVKMVSGRSGKTDKEVSDMFNRVTWIGAAEAMEHGLCDSIEYSKDKNKRRLVASEPKAMWQEANEVLNSVLQSPVKVDIKINKLLESFSVNTKNAMDATKKIKDHITQVLLDVVNDSQLVAGDDINDIKKVQNKIMKNVANKLGLNPDASEESIVAGIAAIENKVTVAEQRATAAEAALATNKTELETLKAKVTTLESEKTAADNAAKEAAKTAAEVKAKNMVEGFAKSGKIKNDEATITAWTAKAVEDFDGVKSMIEALPVNKSAVKIETTNAAPHRYTAAMAMIEVQNKHKQN